MFMDWGVSVGSFTHAGACLLKNMAVQGFPRWFSGKEHICQCGRRKRHDLIPGKTPGEGNENPLQYSGLENPMDRGAWWATVHEVAEWGHD